MDPRPALVDLLTYTAQMAAIGERAVLFRVAEYRNLLYFEHELRSQVGIAHDVAEGDERVWLRIERLSRRDPPAVPEAAKPWIVVSRDPSQEPKVLSPRQVTVPAAAAEELVVSGRARKEDVAPAQKARDGLPAEQLRDVILRIENDPKANTTVHAYRHGPWANWAAEEKPRRETIRIYETFFNLYQAIETQGVERPLEAVWGVGVVRWKHQREEIDHPLIEQLVELDVDAKDGAIRIIPRTAEPSLAIKPYQDLSVEGADRLQRIAREHFQASGAHNDFSPFIRSTFEPILRQASSLLDPAGRFLPDILEDKEDRTVPAAGPSLLVTDTWAIYARPRSANIIVQDIERLKDRIRECSLHDIPQAAKRLVSRPDDTRPDTGVALPKVLGSGIPVSGSNNEAEPSNADALFFPKPYNDEQVEIVRRLEREDGVVVQGPPGTGKTHTIANIICHYMATGRRVLVVSHGEGALGVLRDQIPGEIRELAISLLTSERQGLKLLERAIRLLENDVSRLNANRLKREISDGEQRILGLKEEIQRIETEFERLAALHLKPLDSAEPMLPAELARRVVEGRESYAWFDDRPAVGKAPEVTDADIARLRDARRKLGNDLIYLGVPLPSPNDLPDPATLGAMHEDLASAVKIAERTRSGELPPLSLTVENALARAGNLLATLREMVVAHEMRESERWLDTIFDLFRSGEERPEIDAVRKLQEMLNHAAQGRRQFLSLEIAIPRDLSEDEELRRELIDALRRQIAGQPAFPMFRFGKRRTKALYSQIRVNGSPPADAETARQVLAYMKWRHQLRHLCRYWNHLATNLGWPAIETDYDAVARWSTLVRERIEAQVRAAREHLPIAAAELPVLFPVGLAIEKVQTDLDTVRRAYEAVALNLSRHRLEASRAKIAEAIKRVKGMSAPIAQEIRVFLEDVVGSTVPTTLQVVARWEAILEKLRRLLELRPELDTVKAICARIAVGAPKWADRLLKEPCLGMNDPALPANWREAWAWAQLDAYLQQIDDRGRTTALSRKRLEAMEELERQMRDVVRARTHLELHQGMTDLVKSSLVRFATAIRQIGAGMGIRARRFRRDAREAMDSCYSAVPCWIMPTWRVSESLPPVLGSFDLVIIDEASQSDMQALPAILRGKKVLVVGDDKQVSPAAVGIEERRILQLRTNFLERQPFAQLLLPGSSLYDLMRAVFPGQSIMLREHFRCVEPIIRFSAREFYDNQILPLRIPKVSERLDPPLIDIYVKNGVRQGKVNLAEAEVIVSEIEQIVADPRFAARSIGVVSLVGAHQAQKVQSMLLERIGEEAYVRHQIACGDSATFQGKERDIMFVSMVDTPARHTTKTGLLYQQRFNVALSRARDRMYLVRSINEDVLRPDDLNARVIRHFQNPMEQAPIDAREAIALCESGFERDVYSQLANRGWRVRPQVRAGDYRIDLVVEGVQDRRLAIELDGDTYHGVDRWMEDRKRQTALERMGWRFWRCWASSWTLDPERCMADLEKTLREMGIDPIGRDESPTCYTEHRVIDARKEDDEGEDEPRADREAGTGFGEEPDRVLPRAGTGTARERIAASSSWQMAADSAADDEHLRIETGDRVVLSYHDEPNRQLTLTLTAVEAEDDPDLGVLYVGRPIARALLGCEEGEVIDVPSGRGIRAAVILKIDRLSTRH